MFHRFNSIKTEIEIIMLEVIEETLIDTLKLLPFLFLTYLAMEYIEQRTAGKAEGVIRRTGKWGPLFGGILGAFPQCGFSTAATNLYAGKVITMGTLIAVYLSTSDEMLPILISEHAPIKTILLIIGAKMVIGTVFGFLTDLVFFKQRATKIHIHEICEQEHCHCEEGSILKSALIHTGQIALFILSITFLLELVMHFAGEEFLAGIILNRPVLGPILAGIVGLIPNCAASVVITTLYLEGVISTGAMMSGLLVGAGVGLLVLFRINHHKKENFTVVALLYAIGVFCGIVIDLVNMFV